MKYNGCQGQEVHNVISKYNENLNGDPVTTGRTEFLLIFLRSPKILNLLCFFFGRASSGISPLIFKPFPESEKRSEKSNSRALMRVVLCAKVSKKERLVKSKLCTLAREPLALYNCTSIISRCKISWACNNMKCIRSSDEIVQLFYRRKITRCRIRENDINFFFKFDKFTLTFFMNRAIFIWVDIK
ncbi:unnamed protein product [Trichogramma brassicae]|uniref:Uncharacterized protein n=1 Tax=Trichogramma brassicae TaxID=86971 RepID=A0A6H5INN4_9HYME|nr:unnamed protein product [Trichogramma brassicae]